MGRPAWSKRAKMVARHAPILNEHGADARLPLTGTGPDN